MFGKNSSGERWIMRYLFLLLLSIHYRRIIKTICPDFIKEDAKKVGRDFHILEIVQVMFYAMIVNEAIELNDLPQTVAGALKDSLVNLNWYSFETKLSGHKRQLLPTWQPSTVADRAVTSALVVAPEESVESNHTPTASGDGGNYYIPSGGWLHFLSFFFLFFFLFLLFYVLLINEWKKFQLFNPWHIVAWT